MLAGMSAASSSTDIDWWHDRSTSYSYSDFKEAIDLLKGAPGQLPGFALFDDLSAGSGVSSCSAYTRSQELSVSLGGHIEIECWAYVAGTGGKTDYDVGLDVSSSTSWSSSTEACLYLPKSKALVTGDDYYPNMTGLTVQPYFLYPVSNNQDNKDPFWITDVMKTNGSQPWLLAWDVRDYRGHLNPPASPSGSTELLESGAAPMGTLRAGSAPLKGGSVLVRGKSADDGTWSVPVGVPFRVRAVPAAGYRFSHWKESRFAKVNEPGKATSIAVLDIPEGGSGAGTITAQFEKVEPRVLEYIIGKAGAGRLKAENIHMPQGLAGLDPRKRNMLLLLGNVRETLYKKNWTKDAGVYRYRSSDGRLSVVLRPEKRLWSVLYKGLSLSTLLERNDQAMEKIAIRVNGMEYGDMWPVRTVAYWQNLTGGKKIGKIDLRNANFDMNLDTGEAMPYNLVLSDAKMNLSGFNPARASSVKIGGLHLAIPYWAPAGAGIYVYAGESGGYVVWADVRRGSLTVMARSGATHPVVFGGGHESLVRVSFSNGGAPKSGIMELRLKAAHLGLAGS